MNFDDTAYYVFGTLLLGSVIFASVSAFEFVGLTGQFQNAAVCAIAFLTVWFLIAHEERAENGAGIALGRIARWVVIVATAGVTGFAVILAHGVLH